MKQYTTLEQTAKLIALGFEKPSPSFYRNGATWIQCEGNYSIGELIELLPDKMERCYSLVFDKNIIQYAEYGVDVIKYFGNSSNIYNNIIDCIEWLISKGYFNKKYLKQ